MNSLKIKMMLIIVLVTVTALSAVSLVVNEWLQGIINEVNTLAENADVQSADPERCSLVFNHVLNNHDDYEDVFATDQQGNTVSVLQKGTVSLADREYFQQAIQGETVIYGPVISKVTGNQIITVVTPTYKDGSTTPTGVTGMIISMGYLQELANNMQLNGYGYGLIQKPDMITIAHPNSEFLGNQTILDTGDERLKELFQWMSEGEKGYGTYVYQGVEKIMAFAPVELTGWSVAQTADVTDIMSPLDAIRRASLSVTLIAIMIMLGIALLIANYISKPIIRLSKIAEAVANGDLTQKVDASHKSNDEIGILTAAFAEMVNNLKYMIGNIRESSNRMATHSQELAASSEEVSATIEEVASTTNEVAATLAQGTENAEEAAVESEQVRRVAEDGNRAVKETVKK